MPTYVRYNFPMYFASVTLGILIFLTHYFISPELKLTANAEKTYSSNAHLWSISPVSASFPLELYHILRSLQHLRCTLNTHRPCPSFGNYCDLLNTSYEDRKVTWLKLHQFTNKGPKSLRSKFPKVLSRWGTLICFSHFFNSLPVPLSELPKDLFYIIWW